MNFLGSASLHQRAVVAAFIVGALAFLACDGDTYRISIVNDTDEVVEMANCKNSDCDDFRFRVRVEPADSVEGAGTVGAPNWYVVHDLAGNELGCFKLDFDHRPAPDEVLLVSAAIPCP